jgi:hypothetical protein
MRTAEAPTCRAPSGGRVAQRCYGREELRDVLGGGDGHVTRDAVAFALDENRQPVTDDRVHRCYLEAGGSA